MGSSIPRACQDWANTEAAPAARPHIPEQHPADIEIVARPMARRKLKILRHVEREPIDVDQAVLERRHIGIGDMVEYDFAVDDACVCDGAESADLDTQSLVHE